MSAASSSSAGPRAWGSDGAGAFQPTGMMDPLLAFRAVMEAEHPSPECGGPCATCAFREGTEANRSELTLLRALFCVAGLVPFLCHEKPGACRGWIAAVNLRGVPAEGEPIVSDARARLEMLP